MLQLPNFYRFFILVCGGALCGLLFAAFVALLLKGTLWQVAPLIGAFIGLTLYRRRIS